LGEAIMSSASQVRAISNFLNSILFGARVESDPDVVSQWGTVAVSYMLNLVIVFLVVATGFAISGYYQPFVAPLADAAVRLPAAIANLLTFALTYIASLEWRMRADAIERQRAANRSRGEYLVLLFLLSVVSLSFLAAAFYVFSIVALVAGACAHSALLQLLMSQRALQSEYRER
jgi:hypothetical protein